MESFLFFQFEINPTSEGEPFAHDLEINQSQLRHLSFYTKN